MRGKTILAAALLLTLVLSGCSGSLSSQGKTAQKPLEDLTLDPSELPISTRASTMWRPNGMKR